MLFRVLRTRRASTDGGVTVETFLRGRVYDRPAAVVRLWPEGTYEPCENKALAGPSENKAGGGVAHGEGEAPASSASDVPPSAILDTNADPSLPNEYADGGPDDESVGGVYIDPSKLSKGEARRMRKRRNGGAR